MQMPERITFAFAAVANAAVLIAWFAAEKDHHSARRTVAASPDVIQFDVRDLDIGTLYPGEPKQFSCGFRNVSPEQTVLGGVLRSCGCFGEVTAHPKILQPGERGQLVGNLLKSAPEGPFQLTVYLEILSNASQSQRLMIHGTVSPAIDVHPKSVGQ